MKERLFVKERGQGLPLIFLHGWGFNHAVWDTIADQLCKNWHVYQVDLPGHGQSPVCEYTFPALTQRLAENLPKNAIWVGWSLGGLLALAMAINQPGRVRSLILVSSSPRFTTAIDWPHAMELEMLQEFAQQLETDTLGTLQRFLVLQVKDSEFIQRQLHLLRALKEKMKLTPLVTLRTSLQLLMTADLRHELKLIQCPSLLIFGGRDIIVPVEVAEDCHRYWPAARIQSIPTAAHLPFLSHPDTFLQQLQAFLYEVTTP
ncbi:MAG: pimeloyl-[acyl-carrier protein] methyl ester esterase [Beggiatoa sp. IS2]|nr:MAG: pimeloyl-[acyl-carrier protein] methyl ester esterase [Beggiatoa sp. IS2]